MGDIRMREIEGKKRVWNCQKCDISRLIAAKKHDNEDEMYTDLKVSVAREQRLLGTMGKKGPYYDSLLDWKLSYKLVVPIKASL